MEVGVGTVCLREFLSCSDTVGVVVWGRDGGVVISNDTEARVSSCEDPDTSDKFEGKNYEVRFMVEGGGRQSASGSRDTNAPDLLV